MLVQIIVNTINNKNFLVKSKNPFWSLDNFQRPNVLYYDSLREVSVSNPRAHSVPTRYKKNLFGIKNSQRVLEEMTQIYK